MRNTNKSSTKKPPPYRTSVLIRWGRLGNCSVVSSLFLFVMCIVQGCSWPATPTAPSPTLNPHPGATSHLKISVQNGAGVNNVIVRSIWTIGNIGCAPIHPISGAAIVKQVGVDDEVERVGSDYLATVIDDRFLPGNCRWQGGAYEVRFMHDSKLLASTGVTAAEFNASGKLELTCIPPPQFPLCELRSKEAFDRAHFENVFNATLEMAK